MPMPRKYPPKKAQVTVEDLASRGVHERSIAQALGASWELWKSWKESGQYPELTEALASGRAKEHDALVSKLFKTATEGKGKESVTAAIFLLKSRHGYVEGSDHASMAAAQVKVTFELPGALKPTEYEAQVLHEALPARKPQEVSND